MAEQQTITTRFDNSEPEAVQEVVWSRSVDNDIPENFDVYEETQAEQETISVEADSFAGANIPVIENTEYVEETSHEGPHIMPIKADYVPGLPITTTSLTTTIFLIFVLLFGIYAKKVVVAGTGLLRTAIVSFVDFTYNFLIDSFDGDRAYARAYYPLIFWVFVLIFFWNIFGLMIDWIGFFIPSIHYVARPIFSDLASTLPLAILTVWYSFYISSKVHGIGHVAKWYAFNWTGDTIGEKAVNVFVWWLHFIGIPSSIASLALRLFGNIFAWVVLIAVLAFLGDFATQSLGWVWVLMTLPFWFFELFVAFIQAAVFTMLMVAAFKQSHEAH